MLLLFVVVDVLVSEDYVLDKVTEFKIDEVWLSVVLDVLVVEDSAVVMF